MKTDSNDRFSIAEQHRAALVIANQPAPDNRIRITRYKAGQVVEIIERTVEQSRTVEKKVFTASPARKANAYHEREVEDRNGPIHPRDMDAAAIEQFPHLKA